MERRNRVSSQHHNPFRSERNPPPLPCWRRERQLEEAPQAAKHDGQDASHCGSDLYGGQDLGICCLLLERLQNQASRHRGVRQGYPRVRPVVQLPRDRGDPPFPHFSPTGMGDHPPHPGAKVLQKSDSRRRGESGTKDSLPPLSRPALPRPTYFSKLAWDAEGGRPCDISAPACAGYSTSRSMDGPSSSTGSTTGVGTPLGAPSAQRSTLACRSPRLSSGR